ncbi:MAG: enoyl-CoA hydratase [Gemmatimonadales bacterium]|jgi:enoyl-CoA hydratase|nr:enoyl-CoA hydratase [Gemmatimonadales bacterium]
MIDITETDDLCTITVDDGRANALNFESVEALSQAIEKRSTTSQALILEGRPGIFCAGLDLAVVRSGDELRLRQLLDLCEGLYRIMLSSPVPIVAACTGHALAGGALMLLCCDYRVGLRGDFRIGFNEVAIGMPLPRFGSDVAQARLNRERFIRATVLAETTGPDEAVTVGFLDEVHDADVAEAAARKAAALVALPRDAYAAGKHIAYRSVDAR